MTMRLVDYKGRPVEVDIGDLDTIARIDISVITGDEHARVIYKDYTVKEFHSLFADVAYDDCTYTVYNVSDGTNLFEDPHFVNRTDSYWQLLLDIEDE